MLAAFQSLRISSKNAIARIHGDAATTIRTLCRTPASAPDLLELPIYPSRDVFRIPSSSVVFVVIRITVRLNTAFISSFQRLLSRCGMLSSMCGKRPKAFLPTHPNLISNQPFRTL